MTAPNELQPTASLDLSCAGVFALYHCEGLEPPLSSTPMLGFFYLSAARELLPTAKHNPSRAVSSYSRAPKSCSQTDCTVAECMSTAWLATIHVVDPLEVWPVQVLGARRRASPGQQLSLLLSPQPSPRLLPSPPRERRLTGSPLYLPAARWAARSRWLKTLPWSAIATRDPERLAALRATIASKRSARSAGSRAARLPQAPTDLPRGPAGQETLPADVPLQGSSVGGHADTTAAPSAALRTARSTVAHRTASEAQILQAKARHARALPIAGQRRGQPPCQTRCWRWPASADGPTRAACRGQPC